MFIAIHIVVFFSRDGHLLECAEASNHWTSNPGSIFSVEICINIYVCLDGDPCLVPYFFGSLTGFATDLLIEALVETWKQSGATREHNIVVQVNLQIVIALLDCLECNISEAVNLWSDQSWIEKDFSWAETLLVTYLYNTLIVRELIGTLFFIEWISWVDGMLVV